MAVLPPSARADRIFFRYGAREIESTAGDPRIRLRLFVLVTVVLAGLLTHGTYAGSGDEPHYLVIADSLAFDHDLDLSNNYGTAAPLIAGGSLQPESHARIGVGGILRPVHDVGMPILFAPYVRIVRPLASHASALMPASVMRSFRLTPSIVYRNAVAGAMILVSALLAVLLRDVVVGFGVPGRTAFWATALVALSPPVLILSILFFTEMISAALCLIVSTMIVSAERPRMSVTWLFVGAGTGMLVLVHIRNVGMFAALVVIGCLRFLRERQFRNLAAFVSGVCVLIVARTALIHHLWGTWLYTPLAYSGAWEGAGTQVRTALGRLGALLVDQEYGLLPYAPIYVLAPYGMFVLARTHRWAAIGIGVVVASYVGPMLLPATNTAGWTGGWSPPARFLMPVVPLLAIGVIAAVQRSSRAVLVPLLVLQIAFDAYVWQHPKVLWNNATGQAAICARIGRTFCDVLPSFVQVPESNTCEGCARWYPTSPA